MFTQKNENMSIDLYVEQLKEDIREAAQKNSIENEDDIQTSGSDFEQHIKEVENYVHGPTAPLSRILGICTIQLPPPEKLSNAQQAAIYKEMELLLNAFNFCPDFPEKLPGHFKYQLMRSRWDNEQVRMNSGQSHLEFCDYEPKECPFPSRYCRCKNF